MSNGTIVVGVDGSEASRDALRWAAKQAAATKCRLQVVMSWDIPAMAYMAALPVGYDWESDTRKVLADTVEEVLGADPEIDVTSTVMEGRPAPVLLEQAKDADLLVVGSRGHGAFTGMLLGSVSEHCVNHAHCPVVVVRTQPHND